MSTGCIVVSLPGGKLIRSLEYLYWSNWVEKCDIKTDFPKSAHKINIILQGNILQKLRPPESNGIEYKDLRMSLIRNDVKNKNGCYSRGTLNREWLEEIHVEPEVFKKLYPNNWWDL